jgi:hypothetical protein
MRGVTTLSLRDVDPVEDLLARLRLDRNARSRGAVIVEGPSDERILDSALPIDRRALFGIGGRSNLLRCVAALDEQPMDGVLCVGDRDFDLDESDYPNAWWFVLYDDADIEAMLVDAEPLVRFLGTWASDEKVQQLGGPEGVRTMLKERTLPLSILRTVNARDRLGIPLNSVDIKGAMVRKTGTLKRESLIGRVLAVDGVTRAEVESFLAEAPRRSPFTGAPLARGRDLMAVLAVLLRSVLASLGQQQVEPQFVENSLSLAVREGDLDDTPFKARFDDAFARLA